MEHEHETPELDQEFDPVFEEEQQHLTETYAKLQTMGRDLLAKMEANSKDAAADKLAMVDELSVNLASYADAMETYADFATVNRVIDAYNLAQTVDAEKLTSIQVLLKQPYFAKVVLQMKPGQDRRGSTSAPPASPTRTTAALWWTGARRWPRCTTTRRTAPRPTRPTAAPSASISSCAASSTSKPIG
ncbi:MAG: hypothetical protein ACLR67_07120 [Eggerthella lenta]